MTVNLSCTYIILSKYGRVLKVYILVQQLSTIIKIKIEATATAKYGSRLEYKMIKSLRIEPIGVKTFNVISENYNFAKNSKEIVHYIENDLVNKDEHKRYITEVTGDYLTEYDKLRSLRH